MLTDAEASDFYKELSNWLRLNGRAVLADDVAREIAIGRRVSRKISVPAENLVTVDPINQTAQRGGSARADFVGRDPFTPIEELLLLCEGIELSIVSPGMMARKILEALSHEATTATTLTVSSEELSSDTYQVALAEITSAQPHADRLRLLLAELRAEILPEKLSSGPSLQAKEIKVDDSSES